jgi:hypothetical protein
MNGAKILFTLTVMGLVLIIGLVCFPSFHTIFTNIFNTQTAGFPPLLSASMVALPYILIGVIIYAVMTAYQNKGH